jgi:predicted Zn-dependent protease
VAATGAVILPHSRMNESEADAIGIKYAARAGYDPRAAITFWQRMKEASEAKGKLPEWLSTHPSNDTRIRNLEKLMPAALEEYEKSLRQ